jgi:hypothetical protein
MVDEFEERAKAEGEDEEAVRIFLLYTVAAKA